MKVIVKALALAGFLLPSAAYAQDYPNKQVTIVVPFSPGASNDALGRYLADTLGKLWKQTVIVENRAGGGSAVGAAYVARQAPDGYKLLIGSASYTTNAATRTDLGFDPVKDLKPISMIGTNQFGVIAGSRVPMTSLADLVREAKSKTILFATAGVGSTQHFVGELLSETMGIKMTPVPYPGAAEGLRDLLGGRVDIMVGGLGGLLPAIESGAKPLAVMSKARSTSLPNVPTTAEAGYPKAITQNYWALFVPTGTPDDVVAKIHEGIKTVTHTPEGIQFLAKLDGAPTELSAQEVATYVKTEIDDWTALAKQLNLKAQ